jgi:hypothetical protein
MPCASNWVISSEATTEKIMMSRIWVSEFSARTTISVDMHTEVITRIASLALIERSGSSGRRSAQSRRASRATRPWLRSAGCSGCVIRCV